MAVAEQRWAEVRRLRIEEPSDAELAGRLALRDEQAYAIAWDRFSPLARRVLMRSLGPTAEVDDTLQEVFLRLFRGARSIRKPEALRAFVIGITVRVARRELRRRAVRRWIHLAGGEQLDEQAVSGFDDEQREALGHLYQLLDSLSPDARTLFVLRYVEQLELTEVAEALGVSLATVKRRLGRVYDLVQARVAADPVLTGYANARGTR